MFVDYSGDFFRVRRNVRGGDGTSLSEFVRGLSPRYSLVWRDIALGYIALIATVAVELLAPRGWVAWLVVPFVAVGIGFWIAYLQLFLHEAAHFNIARRRARNDLLANVALGWPTLTDVKSYRVVHLGHHRMLGTIQDTEPSYFNALTARHVLRLLAGVESLRLVRGRNEFIRSSHETSGRDRLAVLAAGLVTHLVIVAGLFSLGSWPPVVAWLLGIGIFAPCTLSVRQIVEHRADDAQPQIDYARVPHGAFTRVFRETPFARVFGAAGFNRHLLHHWEPQVSYTRLPQLEAFIRETELAGVLEARHTTYSRAFRRLVRQRDESRDATNVEAGT